MQRLKIYMCWLSLRLSGVARERTYKRHIKNTKGNFKEKKIREQSVMNCCFNFFNNEETCLIISKKYMYIY